MGTSKHLVILLTIALGGILAAGQDQPAASAPSSQPKASNTRFASCILRITVDPAIMPLSLENIESLLQSSGVAVKAGREVLGLNEMEVFNLPLFKVEWLNASSASMPAGARSFRQAGRRGPDEEMPRQMEQFCGRDYMVQMMGSSGEGKREGAQTQTAQPAASPQYRPETMAQRLPGESDAAYRARLNQMRVKVQQQTKARGTEGMGGYGGGMAGGMGGMGGYGGMGSYRAPGSAGQGEGVEQTATVRLIVELPENVPPRADEFLGAVVTNLRESLRRAHESCLSDIEQMLVDAKTQYQFVESRLDSTTGAIPPATTEIRKQLDMYVDLSLLTSQMPLATAIEVLRKSVDPPLNIAVLWRDLEVNLNVLATSPINIDGSPKIRLRTALDLLAKGLYSGSATAIWRIRDDTIVIGTAATLEPAQGAAGQSQVDADAVNLAGQRSELTRKVQTLELDLAGLEARWQRIVSEIPDIKKKVGERLSQDAAAKEMERLVQMYATKATTTPEGRLVSPDSPEAQQNTIRARIELANRREELSKQAGGSQLDEFNKELTRIVIDQAEKRAQLKIVRTQLDEVQKQLAQALAFDPETARLRLAREALDTLGRRVVELQTRMADLQPPTVTVIGAN
ncbi:MAG: hypothetical protein M1376_12780 [Planctomycetes bacterium]|nr:hypothetical protein [Planctomycetota bacterium]